MTLPLLPLIHYKLIKNTVLLYGLSSYHLASLLQFTPTPVNGCFCAYRRNLFFHFAQMPPLKFSYPHSCPSSLFYPLFSLQSTPFCPFFSLSGVPFFLLLTTYPLGILTVPLFSRIRFFPRFPV